MKILKNQELSEIFKWIIDNQDIEIDSKEWLRKLSIQALAAITKPVELELTDKALEIFHSKVQVDRTGVVYQLEDGLHSALSSIAPNAIIPDEYSNQALEAFYSKTIVEETGNIVNLREGIRAVVMATPELNHVFIKKQSDEELLEIAREIGLRGLLHSVNATDAKAILKKFVDVVNDRNNLDYESLNISNTHSQREQERG